MSAPAPQRPIEQTLLQIMNEIPSRLGDPQCDNTAGMVVAMAGANGLPKLVYGATPGMHDLVTINISRTLLQSAILVADPTIQPLIQEALKNLEVAAKIRNGELVMECGQRFDVRHLT